MAYPLYLEHVVITELHHPLFVAVVFSFRLSRLRSRLVIQCEANADIMELL